MANATIGAGAAAMAESAGAGEAATAPSSGSAGAGEGTTPSKGSAGAGEAATAPSTGSPSATALPERLDVGGDGLVIHVTSAASEGAAFAYEVEIGPGGGPPALHRHAAFELFRVEHGELAFYLADDSGDVQRTLARAGEVVAIAGGREHTVRNESGATAGAFVVLAPGTEMESFVRAVAQASGMDEVLAVAAAHDVEITRPLP